MSYKGMNKKILLIEDESGIAETIIYALSTEGFECVPVSTGKDGLNRVTEEDFDLVILDIGLPDMSGFEVIKQIRTFSDISVLILTARSDEIDRVLGLELGSDDYVIKPFSPRELTARIKAILRRSEKKESPSSGTFNIDHNKRQITYYGKMLSLSRYEYEILCLFLSRPGWVFSRDQIMNTVWTEPEESFDRTVDAHIKTIRAKLRAINPDKNPVETHRGIGYSMREEI